VLSREKKCTASISVLRIGNVTGYEDAGRNEQTGKAAMVAAYICILSNSLHLHNLHYTPFYCILLAMLLVILITRTPEPMHPALDVLRRMIILDNLPQRQTRRHVLQFLEVDLWQSLIGVVVHLRIA
jgi:hypothetical protein